MNKKRLLLPIILSIVLVLSFVIAQEEVSVTVIPEQTLTTEEPTDDPGITPDNPLWGLDKAIEKIELALTLGKSAKAQKGLQHAHERLLEVKEMIEKNKLEYVEKAEQAHTQTLTKVRARIQALEEEDEEDIEKVAELENTLDNQEDELDNIRTKVKIKIEGLTLTEEQIARLFVFINSLDENIERVRIDIENKQERTKIKIKQKTGKSEIEIEDSLGKLKEKRKVKAKVFGDFSKVKVEYKFTIRATSKKEVIKQIIERFALTEEQANRLLKVEREDEEEEPERLERLRIKAEIKTKHGVSFAKIKVKLRFTDGIDRDSIINEIVLRTQLTEQEILDVIEFKQKVEEEEEKEIEVEIKEDKGFSKVEIKWLGKKIEFKLQTTDREVILKEISIRLGVPVEELMPFIEFEIEMGEEEEDEEKEDLIEFADAEDENDNDNNNNDNGNSDDNDEED